MNTRKFKTRTEFTAAAHPKMDGIWEIGLDPGYSSMKVTSPNSISVFPSMAVRSKNELQFAGKIPDYAIEYRDLDTNELWIVGECAQNTINSNDTTNSDSIMYNRNRCSNPSFKVLVRTAIGCAMIPNAYGAYNKADKIVVQGCLPERYLMDAPDYIDVISGHHHFALKIGSGNWHEFDFSINAEDIDFMSQPKASLFTVCVDSEGKLIPERTGLLSSSVVVLDPGFGTFDLFIINKGEVLSGETFPDLGMKRVFEETSKMIESEYHVNVPVHAMQPILESGVIRVSKRKPVMEVKEYPIDKFLMEANAMVCEEAIDRMIDSVGWDNLTQFYKALIITGGTGAAWSYIIADKFKAFEGLSIINANQNNNRPLIYSNSIGCYLYRYNKLFVERKKAS